MKALLSLLPAAGLSLLLAGCVGLPADALKLPPDSLANRQMQSRAFDGLAEPAMLAACAGTFQDLGFTIDESDAKLGVIVASKERSAVNQLEVALSVLGKISTLGLQPLDYTRRQVIRASLVTRTAPTGGAGAHTVRVTFQRRVYDNLNRVRFVQQLNEPQLFEEFYQRLAQSVALTALIP